MRRFVLLMILIGLVPLFADVLDDVKKLTIPYTQFTLTNGLRVVVHEDHRTPIVSVVALYGVGSKNENIGRRGFAHLFEHLMFNGSKHFNDDYFKALEKVGASNTNGNTSRDRTIYFETVPSHAVDTALWLESDRMGYLLDVVDQARLDEQRKVVLNEKRQKENAPYGKVMKDVMASLYPQGHPYSWLTIGTNEDLEAASLADVKEWFNTYYGASNSVLVLSGDITTQAAREKAEKFFGGMPVGGTITQPGKNVAPRSFNTTQTTYDRVPQARLYKVWNIPEMGSEETDALNLLSDVLGAGKSSRLYKRLVEKEQMATSASAYIWPSILGSNFFVEVTARPGVSLEAIEKIVNDELQKIFDSGVTSEELNLVRTQALTAFLKDQQTTMSKAHMFAYNMLYFNDPAYYKTSIMRITDATTQSLHTAAKAWLVKGDHTTYVLPFEAKPAAKDTVDRAKVPISSDMKTVKFPEAQTFTLKNGIHVKVIENKALPLVNGSFIFTGGIAHDPSGQMGVAATMTDMMNFGTQKKNPQQWEESLTKLGASIGVGSGLEHSSIGFDTLKASLPQTFELILELLKTPRFTPEVFQLVKKNKLDQLRQEITEPASIGTRVFRSVFFKKGTPFSRSPSGLGTLAELQNISLEAIQKMYGQVFQPQNATLVIVGDVDASALQKQLDSLIGKWAPKKAPALTLFNPTMNDLSNTSPTIYLVNRPQAVQSHIMVGLAAPARDSDQDTLATLAHQIFGGTFTSRVNMNLREAKGWSYGIRSQLQRVRGPRAFAIAGGVQTDKTVESLLEIRKELTEVTQQRPFTEEELTKVKVNLLNQMPAWIETNDAMAGQLDDLVKFQLPSNYYQQIPERVSATKLPVLKEYAKQWISPAKSVYVVIGDKDKLKSKLEQAGLGKIVELDPETLDEVK